MKIRVAFPTAALLSALALATVSCQSAPKNIVKATPPAQAQAPSLKPKNAETPAKPAADAHPVAQNESAPAKEDSVDRIVAEAEQEYRAGQENYSAGHLEAAKENFDRAFDLLAQAPGGANSDERLQREFEKIVEGVNSLELVALKEGDGFTEQKSEPAPIDEANEVTFPVDPNVKAKAAEEVKETHSDLPLVLNDEVAGYINYFSSRGRGVLEHALTRSGMYRDMVQRILKQEGVPQDLIYLAQAESGFHPLALSRAGARGMWQFMASRAAGYGLSRNWWVDDRQDPEKSTRAAARHLKDLYNQFGDWYLAMAAYNSGPGTVQQAVQRTGYADFWQLYRRGVLPAETKNYVPIILAVTIMAKNPGQYGLDHIVPEAPLAADSIHIDYPVDLRLVAECLDTSVTTLQDLNPSLLRMTTPKASTFELHLPAGTTDKYQQAIAAIPRDMRVWWRFHRVAAGDTLAGIARTYHTTPHAIAEANDLDGQELKADSKLIIPIAPGRRVEEGAMYSRRATRYKVRRGDTLSSVADDFGVPVERLRRWNGIRSQKLRPGRVLLIHLPAGAGEPASELKTAAKRRNSSKLRASKTTAKSARPTAASAKTAGEGTGDKPVYHKVQRGETLTSIASSYNTTVSALRRDNAKRAGNLRAGDVLLIRETR